MKKSIIFKTLIVLFSIMSFVSCETEPLDPAIDLADFATTQPSNPNNPSGIFTAKIDGLDFIAINITGQYTNTINGNTQLILTGANAQGKSITIRLLNPSVSTIAANTELNTFLRLDYNDPSLGINGFFSSYDFDNDISIGSFSITNFNTLSNKISGSFNFTGFNDENSSTIEITQGIINNITFDNQVTVTPPPPTGIVGTYLMTAFNISVPQDLNGDGVASINQMSETICFNNNTLVVNPDNTFTATANGLEIDGIGPSAILTCFSDPTFSGTWSQNGNNITFTYVDAGISYSDVYVLNGNSLTISVSDGEVVGSSSTGEPVYLTADIAIVYNKQ